MERGSTEEASGAATSRSTRERLSATLRQKEEALSPRVLRRTLEELKAIVDPRVSEVEGGRRAQGVAGWYARATVDQRRDMWLLMSEQFVADAEKVKQAQAQFAAAVGTPDEAAAEVHYRRATVSPRRRLLQRFSVFPGGIRFLVDLRADDAAAPESRQAPAGAGCRDGVHVLHLVRRGLSGPAPHQLGFARVADRKAHQVRGGA